MRHRNRTAIGLATLALAATATLRADGPAASSPAASQPAGKAQWTTADLVDPDALKALLPATLGTFKQQKTFANKTVIPGMSQSQATADYKGADETPDRGTVSVTDYAGSTGMTGAMNIILGIGNADTDDADQFSKTIKIKGHDALETFRKVSRHGNIKVNVKDRFVVEFDAEPMDEPQLRAAAEAFDYQKLEAMEKK